jgi:hypothetical protein
MFFKSHQLPDCRVKIKLIKRPLSLRGLRYVRAVIGM